MSEVAPAGQGGADIGRRLPWAFVPCATRSDGAVLDDLDTEHRLVLANIEIELAARMPEVIASQSRVLDGLVLHLCRLDARPQPHHEDLEYALVFEHILICRAELHDIQYLALARASWPAPPSPVFVRSLLHPSVHPLPIHSPPNARRSPPCRTCLSHPSCVLILPRS